MFTGPVLYLKQPPTEITLIERYSGKDLPTEEKNLILKREPQTTIRLVVISQEIRLSGNKCILIKQFCFIPTIKFSFKIRPLKLEFFGMISLAMEANRKSQKLSPL